MKHYNIELTDLPKVSTNKIYAGIHWKERKRIKDNYKLIIKNQFKTVYTNKECYVVEYIFVWKKNPLDAMNCTFMAKMIEDIIFEDDEHDIITNISISSKKGDTDRVHIQIIEL